MLRASDVLDSVPETESETPVLDGVNDLNLPGVIVRRVIDLIVDAFPPVLLLDFFLELGLLNRQERSARFLLKLLV